MGTLVERDSQYLCPVSLPHGHDADSAKDALFGAVKDLPAYLRRSMTWDQEDRDGPARRPHPRRRPSVYLAHAYFRGSAASTRTPMASSGNTSRKGRKFPATLIICGR